MFSNYRECGYDGLQLKGGDYQPFLESPAGLFERWPALRGGISGLILGQSLSEAGVAMLRKTIRAAGEYGADRVIFCDCSPRGTAADLKRSAKLLSDLGAEALALKTKLSLHHHHNQPVMTREEMRLFFAEVGNGTVGLTIDTAHLLKSGIEDVGGVIREFSGVIDNFHIKDFANGEFVPLGTGVLNLKDVGAAIRAIGYKGWLRADEESGLAAEPSMRACLPLMRSLSGRS